MDKCLPCSRDALSAWMAAGITLASACTPALNRTTYIANALPSTVGFNAIPLAVRGGSTLPVRFGILEGNGQLVSAILDFSLDGGQTFTGAQALDPRSASWSWEVPLVDVSEAVLRITARDENQKVTVEHSPRIIIDSTPPLAPAVALHSSALARDPNVRITVNDCSDRSKILVNTGAIPTRDDPEWVDCSSTPGANRAQVSTDGAHAFTLWAMDSVGNISTSGSNPVSMTFDGTLPITSITSPVGGEFWAGGTTQTISWTSSDLHLSANPVTLDFTSDGGASWTPIASSRPAIGSFTWTVPNIDGSQFRVRVRATDDAGNVGWVQSPAPFTIDSTNPTLTLQHPIGGEYISGGSTALIRWSAGDTNLLPAGISLEVSDDSGATWNPIASGLTNSGSYLWNVPAVDSSSYRIRIRAEDKSGRFTTVASATNFTVDSIDPVITLTRLTGGEHLRGGATETITWTASDSNLGSTPIRIETSNDSGSTWAALSSSLANTGSYSWTVPSVDLTTFRIRVSVTDLVGRVARSASTSDFTIDSTAPAVTLTSLNGGQLLTGGSTYSLTWTATDAHLGATPVLLELSTDGGGSWSSIAPPQSNSGNSLWTAPSVDSTTYRVRVTVTDRSGQSTTAASSSNFTIDSTAPTLAITAPSGGSFFSGGSTTSITWTSADTHLESQPITIEGSTDGTMWTPIATEIANTGSFAWTLPALDVATYRLRVRSVDRAAHATVATSGLFTIDSTDPSVTLTSLTGCEVLTGGSSRAITWSATDANFGSTPIRLQLSTDSGATWSDLAAGLSNTGSHSWTVPSTVSTTHRIRIIATDRVGRERIDSSSYDLAINTVPVRILGQPDGVSTAANRGADADSDTLNRPHGISSTGTAVFVADQQNNRVLIFDPVCQLFRDEQAMLVLGQTSFQNNSPNVSGVSASSLFEPTGVMSDGTRLCVADRSNHRVLIWNSLPMVSGQPADVVIGQPDFTSNTPNTGGISAARLSGPTSCLMRGGKLFVSDTGNNRVLIWNAIPATSGAAANVVVGQSDFTSKGNYVSEQGMNGPRSVEVVGSRLVVADHDSHRVLIFNAVPTSNGAAADLVLGQTDFISFLRGATSASTVTPFGIATDGTKLAITDEGYGRVLIWDTFPTANNQPASRVITSSGTAFAPDVLGITSAGADLWINDAGKHRAISFRW